MLRPPIALLTVLTAWVSLAPAVAMSAEALHVAVAANFRSTAEAFAELYETRFSQPIRVSSASTGVLAAQLRGGAPFDVLLAADRTRPQQLAEAGLARGAARCYARGSLVLLGAPDLGDALSNSEARVAIANPRSAPYGAAAQAVLQRAGFWESERPRVVMGNNVLQAYQYYASGVVDLALVARSLSPAGGTPIPGDWHPPIEQYLIVTARSALPAQAEAFVELIASAKGRGLLQAAGYQACS